MHCERNETVPRVVSGSGLELSWFEVKQISCPSGDPAGCMPSSYPLSQSTRRTGHPQLWWLLQFEGRAHPPDEVP